MPLCLNVGAVFRWGRGGAVTPATVTVTVAVAMAMAMVTVTVTATTVTTPLAVAVSHDVLRVRTTACAGEASST